MKKDEFSGLNKTRKKGNGIIIVISIIAICITGVMYAKKLQQESTYISYAAPTQNVAVSESRC